MHSLSFAKLIPGGNPTLLLTDANPALAALPRVAAALMAPLHLQAEQVGALFLRGGVPHLQMMGGEFCVNATRAAAFLLAKAGRLSLVPSSPEAADAQARPHRTREAQETKDAERVLPRYAPSPLECPVWEGWITVSGADEPTRVLVSAEEYALECFFSSPSPPEPLSYSGVQKKAPPATSFVCAARVPCPPHTVRCEVLQPGVHLVTLPGISHLLVDTALHPRPQVHGTGWKESSASWRLTCGLAGSPASGVVWHEKTPIGYRILPAVEVAATHSEHLETACGSASVAMGLYHNSVFPTQVEASGVSQASHKHAPARPASLSILQPSGESLCISFEPPSKETLPGARFSPEAAWVSGTVVLVAEGTAYI